ncbi:response regulator [Marinitoga sp. 1138]|uniref:response regulator n=1 Tax=Marinitoga sp. 1138 TaxID=1643334 RepID=UPI0015868E04|nr:response regulator [Marinitoga sp. 1138]NUU96911.1 hypothetical protein [Marinitoga sp. 1138]
MTYKVMVVDDSPLIRNLVKKALKKTEEFEFVGEAKNGEEAVNVFKEVNPDIITMDVTMPIKDGLEASKEILAINNEVKILLLSAMGDDDLIEEAKNIGISHNMQKPFKANILLEKLKSMVGE